MRHKSIRCKCGEFVLSFDASDHFMASAFRKCKYEQLTAEVLKILLMAGMTFVDVGAHIGFYSALASRAVGTGRVFAFEPNPETFFHLQHNMRSNSCTNVECINKAVGNFTKKNTPFFIMNQSSASSLLHPNERTDCLLDQKCYSVTRTDVISIDDFSERFGLEQIDLLKVDVEGSELAVVKGAARTIQRHQPLMMIELHGNKNEYVLQILESEQYSIFQCDKTTIREIKVNAPRLRGEVMIFAVGKRNLSFIREYLKALH